MLRRGRADEREMQGLCRGIRRLLTAADHADPTSLAAEPVAAGYVCGLVFAVAAQIGRTESYRQRLVRRGYVEIFGDACEAVDFLTLTPGLQSDASFINGYRTAVEDSSDVACAEIAEARLGDWLASSGV